MLFAGMILDFIVIFWFPEKKDIKPVFFIKAEELVHFPIQMIVNLFLLNSLMPGDMLDQCRLDLSYFCK